MPTQATEADTGRHHITLGRTFPRGDQFDARRLVVRAVDDARRRPTAHPLTESGYFRHHYVGRHAADGGDPSALATLDMLLDHG